MKDIILKIRKLLWENKGIWICALLGAFLFILIYGVHVLNPCYTDWLLTSEDGDLTQHYIGWKFFRHAKWRFPIGLVDTIAYPNLTSIIFTDSIPLFAVFFKVFRFLLPPEFQYFGWFGLLCFMLQGGMGAALVKKYIKNDFSVIIGGLFFVLCPVFIDRMYWMTALAAHFLCLLSLLFLVYYDERYKDTKKAIIGWGLAGALCSSIHIYFLPMCGVILIGFIIMDLVKGRKKWKALLPLVSFVGMAALTIFLLGGFSTGIKAGNDGLGYYSFNLNGFYNPQGWSGYLKDLPYTDSQYEGFAYLGVGVLVLFLFAAVSWAGSHLFHKTGHTPDIPKENKGKRIKSWLVLHIQTIVYLLIIVAVLILSASTVVMYHDKVLYELTLPGFMIKMWSVFRATGRLIWPMVYLLILGAISMDNKLINTRTKGLMLTICLLLQFADIRGILAEKNNIYNKVDSYETLLPSEEWRMIATETEIKHICFASDITKSRKLLFSFGDYASDYGLTISNFYFARSLGDKELSARQKALTELSPDTIFIFQKNELQQCISYDMNYFEIDDLIIGCSQPLGDLQPLATEALVSYQYDLSNEQYMNNGEIVDGAWNIHSYGNTYGPYLNVGPGRYKMTAEGSNLAAVDVKCYYKNGDINLEPQNLKKEENLISYEVELKEPANDLEFALWNVGGSDITVTSILIEMQ